MTKCCDSTHDVEHGHPTVKGWCDIGWHGCERKTYHHMGRGKWQERRHVCRCGFSWS